MVLNGKKTCLFCMGAYGMRTLILLEDRGSVVSFLGDSNPEKIGKKMRGIKCLSLDDCLSLSPNEYQIVVCNKKPEELIRIFSNAGFDTYDCKSVWEQLDKLSVSKKIPLWNSPDELKALHSAVMKIHRGEKPSGANSSYGQSLLQDLIYLGSSE